jgi:hypothetical protein
MEAVTFPNLAGSILERIDISFTRPDEMSGSKYKAPDYSPFNGAILVELKSLNPEKRLLKHIEEIAEDQKRGFFAFGIASSTNILNSLPDRVGAAKRLHNRVVGQLTDCIGNARDKFDEYERHLPNSDTTRVLIITDNATSAEIDTCAFEREIGRQMGGLDNFQSRSGNIDSVLYMRPPRFVWNRNNSYWLKVLRKAEVGNVTLITDFISHFHAHATISLFGNSTDQHSQKFRVLKVS